MIRQARKETKLSQEQFGQRCGWDQGRQSHYETGRSSVGIEELRIIAKTAKWSLSKLIGEVEKTGAVDNTSTKYPNKEIEELMSMVTPRSKTNLEKINKAASEGKLTEEHIKLLKSIADHLMK